MSALKKSPKKASALLPISLILIMLFAFFLRLYMVDASSFWTDEGLTPLRSGYDIGRILSNELEIQGVVGQDTHPALYYLIIHASRQLFGETDFAYRYPSVLFGLLLVPLLFQFGRRLHGWQLGLLVAGLTAVNPTHIYYAREARMYTLFVLLAAAGSYALWRAIQMRHQPQKLPAQLGLYLLCMGLAFYTHYTTVFLIAAQSLFWLWLLWQAGYKKLIGATAVFAFLLSLPLIFVMVPRLYAPPEADFSLVNPFTMLHDITRGFGIGITVDFSQPLVKLLDAVYAALLLAGIYAAKRWRKRLFLLSYLLTAVFGLMLGSWLFKPMYQGVRHILVGSPAFLLLVGWGALFLLAPLRKWRLLSAPLVIGALILVPLIALNNLYNDPTYLKNDYRALIAYIEQHAGENDVVVYNNAVLMPIQDHYQSRALPTNASPSYPHTATAERVAAELGAITAEYGRLWFITAPPPADRDQDHLAHGWLDENLVAVDDYIGHSRTTDVRVVAYAVTPPTVDVLPETAVSLDISWDNNPALNGITIHSNQPISRSTLWFDLFWENNNSIPPTDLRFSLQDETGDEWAAIVLPFGKQTAATGRWQQRPYRLPLPVGLPPSDGYHLFVQPLNEAGDPIGEAKAIAPIAIAATESRSTTPAVAFSNGVTLDNIILADDSVKPGHALPIALLWHSENTQPNTLRYRLQLLNSDGDVWREQEDNPLPDWLPNWPSNSTIRENNGIYFRPDTPPGIYRLRWQLLDDGEMIDKQPVLSLSKMPFSSLFSPETTITVEAWPMITDPPTVSKETAVSFGENITLVGYDLVESDGALQLNLYWNALAQSTANSTLFVHLRDNDGNIIAQIDRLPGDGLRPTNGWRTGEYISDSYHFPLPDNTYEISIGLYDPDSFVRLPVTENGNRLTDDQFIITP